MAFYVIFILLTITKELDRSSNNNEDVYKSFKDVVNGTKLDKKTRQEYMDMVDKLRPGAVYDEVCNSINNMQNFSCEIVDGKNVCKQVDQNNSFVTSSCKPEPVSAKRITSITVTSYLPTETIYITPELQKLTAQQKSPVFNETESLSNHIPIVNCAVKSDNITTSVPKTIATNNAIYLPNSIPTNNVAHELSNKSLCTESSTLQNSITGQIQPVCTISCNAQSSSNIIATTIPKNTLKSDCLLPKTPLVTTITQTIVEKPKRTQTTPTQKPRSIYRIPVVTPVITFTQSIISTVTNQIPTVVVQTSFVTQPYYYPPQILTQTVTVPSKTNNVLYDIKRMLSLAMFKTHPSTVYVTQPYNNYFENLYSQQKNEIYKLNGELSRIYQLINQGAVIKPRTNKTCYVNGGTTKKDNCTISKESNKSKECDLNRKVLAKKVYVRKRIDIDSGTVNAEELEKIREKAKKCNEKNKDCKVCEESVSDESSVYADCYSNCLDFCKKRGKQCKQKCDKICNNEKDKNLTSSDCLYKSKEKKTNKKDEKCTASDSKKAKIDCSTKTKDNNDIHTSTNVKITDESCKTTENIKTAKSSKFIDCSTKATGEKYQTVSKSKNDLSSDDETDKVKCYDLCKQTCKKNKSHTDTKVHCIKDCIDDCYNRNGKEVCKPNIDDRNKCTTKYKECMKNCYDDTKEDDKKTNSKKCIQNCFKQHKCLFDEPENENTTDSDSELDSKDITSKQTKMNEESTNFIGKSDTIESTHNISNKKSASTGNKITIDNQEDKTSKSYYSESLLADDKQEFIESQTISDKDKSSSISDDRNSSTNEKQIPTSIPKSSITDQKTSYSTATTNYLFDILAESLSKTHTKDSVRTQTHDIQSYDEKNKFNNTKILTKNIDQTQEQNDEIIGTVEMGDVINANNMPNDNEQESGDLEYFYLSDLLSDSNMFVE
ncbi:hypothetical protein BDAP_002532 [Binucleata daphniae]